ncbi:MAG: hypothetical protein V3R36_02315 [Dehalococcoidales bacterium]
MKILDVPKEGLDGKQWRWGWSEGVDEAMFGSWGEVRRNKRRLSLKY